MSDEDHVGNILLQIWELTFGPKAKFLVKLWAQGFEIEVQARFWSWSLFSLLRWCFVEVMKLSLGRDSEARFGQDVEMLMFGWDF